MKSLLIEAHQTNKALRKEIIDLNPAMYESITGGIWPPQHTYQNGDPVSLLRPGEEIVLIGEIIYTDNVYTSVEVFFEDEVC